VTSQTLAHGALATPISGAVADLVQVAPSNAILPRRLRRIYLIHEGKKSGTTVMTSYSGSNWSRAGSMNAGLMEQ
jgi:hypothetical protein